jgi:hypothetical protein
VRTAYFFSHPDYKGSIDLSGPYRPRQHLATPQPVQLRQHPAQYNMHPALLVDELLQEVFDLCCLDNDYRKTLVQLARCCQAWKEPALRNAWESLPCVTPLTKLIVGPVILESPYIPLTPVQATNGASPQEVDGYARMVKRVRLGAKIEKDVALGTLFHDDTPLFPNLQSVAVLMNGCAAPAVHLLLSPMISTVTIDIGVSTGRATGVERSGNIAAYLSSLRSPSIPIKKLSIRGFACEKLNQAICGLSALRSLSLKVGTSLSTSAVIGIASFPSLEELFIHADRIDPGSLEESLVSLSSPVFPKLRTLDIRSSVEVAATILQYAGSTNFTRFSIEVTQHDDDSTWTHLYSVIPATVQGIHIDYHIDLDEPTSDTTDTTNDHPFTIRKLGVLSRHTTLRAFTLGTNIRANFADKDIEELTKWWPSLEALDFTVSSYDECKGDGEQEVQLGLWTPQLTTKCLSSVAKGWPHLERLCLPINLASESNQMQSFPVHAHLREFKVIPSLPSESRSPLIDANIASIRNLFPSITNDLDIFN